jgi:hypothetical protein
MSKKIFIAIALASCSFIPSLIFTCSTFTQGKSLRESCLIGPACAAAAEPNVNFSNSNDSEELTSKILKLNDDKSLSSQTETQNILSGDPNSVPVFIPPVVIPPPPVVITPPPVVIPPPPPPEIPPPPPPPPGN